MNAVRIIKVESKRRRGYPKSALSHEVYLSGDGVVRGIATTPHPSFDPDGFNIDYGNASFFTDCVESRELSDRVLALLGDGCDVKISATCKGKLFAVVDDFVRGTFPSWEVEVVECPELGAMAFSAASEYAAYQMARAYLDEWGFYVPSGARFRIRKSDCAEAHEISEVFK